MAHLEKFTTQVETPSWTTRELYEHLVDLEGEKINLREVLANMGPQNIIHVHLPVEEFPPHLISIGLTHHKLSRRLTYERLSYPHAKYESSSIMREFERRRARIDKMLEDAVENEYGMRGPYFTPTAKIQEAVILFHGDKDILNPTEIEILLRFSKVDFMPSFHPPGKSSGGSSDNINATRVDENEPDIYEINTLIPHHIVDPTLDPKTRVIIFPDKLRELYGENKYGEEVSEEAPGLVLAMLAARV